MKKMLAVLAAGVLAAGMCAGFVACGEGDGGDMGIDENTVFADIVSDKVTEKQWNGAFKLDENGIPVNCKNYKYECIFKSDSGEISSGVVSVDGNKLYCKSTGEYDLTEYGGETDEHYAELLYDSDEEEWYSNVYIYEDGFWGTKKDYIDSDDAATGMKYRWAFMSSGAYTEVLEDEEEILTVLPRFDYDEEKKGYVGTSYFWDEETTCIVKFKNGKYCGCECYRNGNLVASVIIYSYGKEKVTLPTVAE